MIKKFRTSWFCLRGFAVKKFRSKLANSEQSENMLERFCETKNSEVNDRKIWLRGFESEKRLLKSSENLKKILQGWTKMRQEIQ